MTFKYDPGFFFNPTKIDPPYKKKAFTKDIFISLYLVIEACCLVFFIGLGLFLLDIKVISKIGYAGVTVLCVGVYISLILLRGKQSVTGMELVRLSRRLKYWVLTFVFCMTLAFVFKVGSQFSRMWVGVSFGVGCVIIVALFRFAKALMTSMINQRLMVSRAFIYGGTDRTGDLIGTLEAQMPDLDILGVIDVRESRFDENGILCHRGKPFAELIKIVKAAGVETVLVDIPWSAEKRIRQIKREFEAINVDVLLAPYHMHLFDDHYDIVTLGETKTLSLYSRPSRGLSHLAKQIVDRVAAAILLVICFPIMALTAIAIKIESRGPILFKQPRQGFNNTPFEMLKFRSMYSNTSDISASKLTTRDDPRVTRVGWFIRRTSIDELPQIVNVLLGQMSLVGPRPHAFGAKAGDRTYMDVVERYAARHRVLPGMTGLAQVRGYRGNTDTEDKIVKRVESDLEYIQRWSLWLDLEILLRTIIVVINPKNAF